MGYRVGMALAWAAIAAGAAGAPLFTDVTANHVPQSADLHSLDIEFGDFDKDNDLDAVIAVELDVNRLYLNDGQGRFTWKTGAFTNIKRDSEDLHVADFNRDGNLDVVFVSEDDEVHELYHGDGKGGFTDMSSRLPWRCSANGVEVADINQDAYPDIFIGCGGQDMILINDKQGGFVNESAQRLPVLGEITQDLKLGDLDVDGDKDLDMVFCNLTCNNCGQRIRDPQVRLLINNGKGEFADETAARMPKNTFSSWDGGYLDFDADGDLDLIICAIEVPGFTPLAFRAYRNDGKGFFADATAEVMPPGAIGRGWDVEVGDLNADGAFDMFLGGWGTQARLLLGTVKHPSSLRRMDGLPPVREHGWSGLFPGHPGYRNLRGQAVPPMRNPPRPGPLR